MLERTPRIRLHQDGRSAELAPGLNEDELREGQLLFEVQCVPGARLRFDDQPFSVVWSDDGRTGYGQLDLTNQVGFHRFSVSTPKETVSFDVRTTTANPSDQGHVWRCDCGYGLRRWRDDEPPTTMHCPACGRDWTRVEDDFGWHWVRLVRAGEKRDAPRG